MCGIHSPPAPTLPYRLCMVVCYVLEDFELPRRGRGPGDLIRALPPQLNHDAPITL